MPSRSQDGEAVGAAEDRWADRARFPAVLVAALAGVLALLVMVEWLAGTDVLLRAGGTSIPTTFTSGALGLVSALAVAATSPWQRRVGFGLVAVVAALVLLEHLLGLTLGFQELPPGDAATSEFSLGRPAVPTVLAYGLLAAAGLLQSLGRVAAARVVTWLVFFLALANGISYLYGADPARGVSWLDMMPAMAALVVGLLAIAEQLTLPGSEIQWLLYGGDGGARSQRVLIPLIVVVVPALGLVTLLGLEDGAFGVREGLAVFVFVVVAIALLVTTWAASGTRRLDAEREGLLAEVQRVNAELEDRVRLRSHEVNRQRTKLALLEERDRIARDLHDRVIQRIFAAGLQVGALSRTVSRVAEGAEASRLPGQLDLIATELDLAIRELRNSIFQLTSIDDHQDLEQVVHDIASRSSRILGFMPRIHVEGDLDGVRSDVAADVASAIQEGLSNVARHARADAAEVSLRGEGERIVVRITDDGVGLPDPLPRSSGISNLMNRARGLGGDATWEPGEPSGTVFTWWVSRDGEVGEYYGNDLATSDD